MKQYRFLDGSMIDVSEDTCRGCYLETADTVPVEIEVIWQNCNFPSVKMRNVLFRVFTLFPPDSISIRWSICRSSRLRSLA